MQAGVNPLRRYGCGPAVFALFVITLAASLCAQVVPAHNIKMHDRDGGKTRFEYTDSYFGDPSFLSKDTAGNVTSSWDPSGVMSLQALFADSHVSAGSPTGGGLGWGTAGSVNGEYGLFSRDVHSLETIYGSQGVVIGGGRQDHSQDGSLWIESAGVLGVPTWGYQETQVETDQYGTHFRHNHGFNKGYLGRAFDFDDELHVQKDIRTSSTVHATSYTGSGASLTGVQPSDSDLTAIAGLSSTGMISRTGTGTAAVRTITGTGSNITVTNGNGVSGDPTLDVGTNIPKLASGNTFTNLNKFEYNGGAFPQDSTVGIAKQANDHVLGTTFNNSYYLKLGLGGYGTGSYRLIGFGYASIGNNPPAAMGYKEFTDGGQTFGNLIFATRSSTALIDPSIRMTVRYDGNVGIGTETPGYLLDVAGSLGADDYYSGTGLQGITETVEYNDTASGDNYELEFEDGLLVDRVFSSSGGGAGGAAANITGAYDVEDDGSPAYTDLGLSEEFDDTTLDASWTVVDGTNGTVNLVGTVVNPTYDMATRAKGMLVQVPNTASTFSMRAPVIASGEQLIFSVSVPNASAALITPTCGVAVTSTNASWSSNIVSRMYKDNSDRIRVWNSTTAIVDATDIPDKGLRNYYRVVRTGGYIHYMVSIDGISWSPLGAVADTGAAFIWLFVQGSVFTRQNTGDPIVTINWVRHCAYTGVDPW